jgi:hypothetical protein
MRFWALAMVVAAGVGFATAQSDAPVQEPQQKQLTKEEKKALAEKLAPKLEEAKALKEKANEVTAKIGELASSGKLPTSDESVKLLQDLVQQLAQINDQLKKMGEEIDAIKGWIEGQNENIPVMQGDIDAFKRVTWGSYFQFQYADTQEGFSRRIGDLSTTRRTNSDGFQARRIRLSLNNKIDSRTSTKVSFDLATGGSRTATELKDVYLQYDMEPSDVMVGFEARVGQQNMGLGYELERSSSDREMPERSIYNRILMNGERNRGLLFRKGLSMNSLVHFGLWNSLTMSDPQMTLAGTFRNLNGTQLGVSGGYRTYGNHYEAGISGFFAKRSRFQYTDFVSAVDNTTTTRTAEAVDRRLIYLDGTYVGLLDPKLTLRGELVTGYDRVPTVGTKRQTVGGNSATIPNFPDYTMGTDVLGYHLQATYNFNPRNALTIKWEYFDPNTHTGGDDQTGIGLAYNYYFNPGAKLTIAHEMFKERSFELRNNVTTIRLQYKL